MKKLLILTSSDRETILAHRLYLSGLFGNEQDVAIFSPQEVGIIQEDAGQMPYEVGFHTVIKTYERFKEDIANNLAETAAVAIYYGVVGKNTYSWYDAVIGTGYEFERESGTTGRAIGAQSIEDKLKVGNKISEPTDASAIFYKRDELTYFLRKFVEVERKVAVKEQS